MEVLRTLVVVALLLATKAYAGNPFPAVNLPSAVPFYVRDRVARELTATRDRLSDVVSPFRGEFHGLGVPTDGSSRAYDLSANGRVVVGTDYPTKSDSNGFVWSPWTGRATYDMSGLQGNTVATSVSADGVYVAGDLTTSSGKRAAFRWSLAGGEVIDPSEFGTYTAASLSGDGSTLVGTHEVEAFGFNDRSTAFTYSNTEGIREFRHTVDVPYSSAVDVSYDGRTVLGMAVEWQTEFPCFGSCAAYAIRQPVLWRNGATILLGRTDTSPRGYQAVATAISADGTTVVGSAGSTTFFSNVSLASGPAFIWHEETGWSDLGQMHLNTESFQLGAHAGSVSSEGSRVIGSATIGTPSSVDSAVFGPIDFILAIEVPFLWDEARGMRDLGDVLRLDYGIETDGWNLVEAAAISDDGTTVIGNGINPDGQREAWRAVLQRNTPEGDLDFDGDLDADDYQTLTANLGLTSDDAAVYYADGDLNADGTVSGGDLTLLMDLYHGTAYGDYNLDGVVNTLDYTAMRDFGHYWNHSPTDIAAWRANFGMTLGNSGTLIPEPAAILVAVTASLTLTTRQRCN